MRGRTMLRVETREQIRRELEEVPPYAPEEVTRAEAVRSLAPQIRGMQSKGYTLPAIAAFLTERGLGITAVVLKGLLKRCAANAVRHHAGREVPDGAAPRTRGRRDPTTIAGPLWKARPGAIAENDDTDLAEAATVLVAKPLRGSAEPIHGNRAGVEGTKETSAVVATEVRVQARAEADGVVPTRRSAFFVQKDAKAI